MQPDAAETVWQGRLLAVTLERWGEHEREIVEHPGAVVILSIDRDGNVAFVRQRREATRSLLLELPAGTAEPDEELELVRIHVDGLDALIPELTDAKTLAALLLYFTSRASSDGR